MVRTEGHIFAERMAEPIRQGLQTYAEQPHSPYPMVALNECIEPINDLLEQQDWLLVTDELQSLTGRIDYLPEAALSLARRLATIAINDTRRITMLTGRLAEKQQDQLPGFSLPTALKAGSHSLLKISRLADDKKTDLLENLNLAGFERNITDYDISDYGLQIKPKGSGYRFTWNQSVQDWMRRQYDPQRYCPALDILVADPQTGKRQTLVHYFWDKVIDVCYAPAGTKDVVGDERLELPTSKV